MSEQIAESDAAIHVFSKPSEEELLAAIQANIEEQNPAHEWTIARVQIVGEAYSQINTDGKPIHEVVASLMEHGLPADRATYLVNCAAEMQRELAERSGATAVRSNFIRWPVVVFWLLVAVIAIKSCGS